MAETQVRTAADEVNTLKGAGTITDNETTTSNGSLSPSKPSKESPDRPENAHGLSPDQTPEGSEGEVSHDQWRTDDLLTKEMEEEEKRMEEANLAEEEEIRRKLEEREKEEKELKEKRYKRLMHLLNKSEFYSQFLLKQIETQEQEKKTKRSKGRVSKKEEKENNSSGGNSSSQESTGRGKKRKASTGSNRAAKKHLREGGYNIGDVIDSETVKASTAAQEEIKEDLERAEQPRLFKNGTMRPYQLDGFSWLMVLYENGVNGILGDEMGLGKTIQCIALICHLVDKGVQGPFLVIGPLSTLPNWVSEFKRFAPMIPTILYHGPDTVRKPKREEMRTLATVKDLPNPIYPVVITSYEVVVRDTKILNRYNWRYICVDEGHRLKNHKCMLAKSLSTFTSTNRLLMTGTPLQNNLAELWSLLHFLMPEIFDSLDVFESWFDVTEMMNDDGDAKIVQQEQEKQIIQTLMKILSPFFLRRVKKDVDLGLPPKRELLVYTPMTPMQVEIYEATLKYDIEMFDKMKMKASKEVKVEYDEKGRPKRGNAKSIDYSIYEADYGSKELDDYIESLEKAELDKPSNVPIKKKSQVSVKLQNRMMQCRRIVNHPYLVNYPLNEDQSFKIDENIVSVCGKLNVLDQLLHTLHKRGHRVLIFSQMTMMMDIIEDYLTLRPKFKYHRLDGRSKLEEREVMIREYNNDMSYFAFLISTRAGSLGINLATADTVIIYDSDWNPQCDLQAQDRCHRIGQTRPVLVLRLITESTVDEHIVERAATKRKLEKMIIQSGKFIDGNAKRREKVLDLGIDSKELLNLLQKRDHERTHKTQTGNVFTQKELDQILDRSDLVKDRNTKNTKTNQELRGVFKVMSSNDE